MDKRFIPAVVAAAQAGQAAYRVPASVTLAQWAVESAYGTHLPPGSNNPFGIKAKEGEPFVASMTWEHLGGKNIRLEQRFRKFDTLAAAFEAHARLIATSKYYVRAMSHGDDPNAFARALTGVYATDPNYGPTLIAVMKANSLYAFDHDSILYTPPVSAAAPAAAKPPAAPVAAAPAHPTATVKAAIMNPVSGMLAAAQAFEAVAPKLISMGTTAYKNKDDLAKQASRLTTDLGKVEQDFAHLDVTSAAADIGDAWKAGQQVFVDVGISYQVVTDTVKALPGIPAIGALENAAAQAEALAKKLGLPV